MDDNTCEKVEFGIRRGAYMGITTTNNAECFTNVLKGGRDLLVCGIVNYTFQEANQYFTNCWDAVSIGYPSPFATKIDAEIQDLIEQGKHFQ